MRLYNGKVSNYLAKAKDAVFDMAYKEECQIFRNKSRNVRRRILFVVR